MALTATRGPAYPGTHPLSVASGAGGRGSRRGLTPGPTHPLKPHLLPLPEPLQDNQLVILISAVSVLLFLFVASVLLCFVFGQHWRQQRTGAYGVQAAWRSLRWPYRP